MNDDEKSVNGALSNSKPGDNEKIKINTRISLNDEILEEYRMVSGFELNEIKRLEIIYFEYTNNLEIMTNIVFQSIPCIKVSPFRYRIEMIFFESSSVTENDLLIYNKQMKHDNANSAAGSNSNISDCRTVRYIKFKDFLLGLSLFNARGQSDTKLKIAFRIQDFDNDGVLSVEDIIEYLLTITGGICNDNQLALADREVIPDEFDDNGVLIISPTRKLIREINVKFMIQKRNELLEEQNSSHGHQSAVGKSPGEHSNATATNPNIEPHANSSTGTNNTINNNANNTGTGNASTIKGPEASKSNEEVYNNI